MLVGWNRSVAAELSDLKSRGSAVERLGRGRAWVERLRLALPDK